MVNGGDRANETADARIYLTIDRFEGDYAVCEREGADGYINIQKKLIGAGASEGALIYADPVSGRYYFDEEATARRTAQIRGLADKLWKRAE